jgi:hypothetical protein
MKEVTLSNYRKDTYYPRVVRAVAAVLSRSDVVTPVDVLLEMGNLTPNDHEAWRKGSVPYLERVFQGSLSKANHILRLIGFHVHDLNMVPEQGVYERRVRGKRLPLRFSRSGIRKIEEAYSRQYTWNQSQEKKRAVIAMGKPAPAVGP